MISASCVYMFTSVKRTSRNFVWFSGMSPMMYTGQPYSWSVNKMGANAQVSFAYLIQPINTSISIGFRYQFYKTVKSDTEQDQYTNYYDHFFGVTASAVYRIEFGSKKDQIKDEEKQAVPAG